MSSAPTRVFAARLAGLPVFDPQGDQVGKVRDVVVVMRPGPADLLPPPRVVGLVVEVFGRRQIFAPMTRVTTIDAGHVITTGLLNMRRFAQRSTETLVIGQMLDRKVTIRGGSPDERIAGAVYDVAMEQTRSREWVLSRVAVQEPSRGFRRRGQTHTVEWREVDGMTGTQTGQGATHLAATLADLRPADAANVIHELPPARRAEVIAELDDERLADVLEELPEEDQVEILGHLDSERAADVLEEMSADDAADLIADLPPDTAQALLALMEPDEADDVRRLLLYAEETAGGMMTPEPVILSPDATVAEALAHVRNEDLTPSLAALVYVCRPPLETPTGRLLGVAHIQRLLREAPSSLVAGALDTGIDPLPPEASLEDVAAHLATYNLVASAVVDDQGRLLGAVTVDDLLDHLLPDGWRDRRAPGEAPMSRDRERADDRWRRSRSEPRLDTPLETQRPLVRRPTMQQDAFGAFAEQFARFMGTARFLLYMSGFVVVWILWNTLAPDDLRFDKYAFIFLTLMLSLQASYAAPLILLAQNRQEQRDRVITEQDRQANARAHADMEFLAREVASLRMAVGEVATRDYVRSELRNLLAELDERAAAEQEAHDAAADEGDRSDRDASRDGDR